NEGSGGGTAAGLVTEAERARRAVEGVLGHRAGPRSRVGTRQGKGAARALDAVRIVESPVAAADLLPEPEGGMGAQPVLQIELRGDPAGGGGRGGGGSGLADREGRAARGCAAT